MLLKVSKIGNKVWSKLSKANNLAKFCKLAKFQAMTRTNLSWMKPLPQAPLRCQVIIEVFNFPRECHDGLAGSS